MDFSVGDRVKHPKLHEEWGPGEILEIAAGGKMVIHFALAGQKTLKGVALEKLSGDEAAHPLLDDRKKPGRRERSTRSFDSMKKARLPAPIHADVEGSDQRSGAARQYRHAVVHILHWGKGVAPTTRREEVP
jgi:hypothetical protein